MGKARGGGQGGKAPEQATMDLTSAPVSRQDAEVAIGYLYEGGTVESVQEAPPGYFYDGTAGGYVTWPRAVVSYVLPSGYRFPYRTAVVLRSPITGRASLSNESQTVTATDMKDNAKATMAGLQRDTRSSVYQEQKRRALARPAKMGG